MGVVDSIIKMQQVMASDRVQWEQVWRDCVNVALPTASHLYDYGGTGAVSRSAATDMTGLANAPKSVQRGRELYNSTAAWATDRLTAGMESLITPRAQKWHALQLDDPFAPEPSDLEEEWLDYLRDYLFGARYDAKANFSLANQKALKNTVVLGTGVVYSEENLGRRGVDPVKVPFFYRSVPLIESYLSIDAFDDVDKVIRVCEWSARAAVAYFEAVGGTVSAKLREKANDPSQADKPVAIMHAVMPREEAGEFKDKRRDSPFASFWIEVDTKHLIKPSGYFSFPYSVTWWDQTDGSAYGQSPVMQMLADIKTLQVMTKASIQAAQQAVKPPLATMAGVYRERPNLNSGAINPGYLTDSGVLKIQPIVTNQNPTMAERIIDKTQMSVQTGLYVTLFQILVDNPQMSATEALIRANEKGELLGPAGAKIEGGIAQRIDREIDIIGRKGAFDQQSPLAPPPSMIGRNVGVKFTGPLARLRRVQELQGVDTVLGIATNIAQYDPSVLDRIDLDESLEIGREISGAPRKMFRTDEEVAARREAAAAQMEQQAALQATEQLAGAAGKAAPALKMLSDARQGRRAA
jgi:hypothetical protein